MSLIDCQQLEKTYRNDGVETHAVRGVTFTLEEGEFISIMGPSGSGKSTLMHILGLLDRPTGGTYLFEGRDASKFTQDELARLRNQQIGFVFQSFNLLSRTSVYENVELPLLYDVYNAGNTKNAKSAGMVGRFYKKMVKNTHRKQVEAALDAVGMMPRIGHLSNQLSGGEKQRVAIARALVNDPKIVFADEPTGNLDSKSGLQVMRILQEMNESGRTIILVTHETYTAEHAKRIIRMKDGRVVSDEFLTKTRNAKEEEELLK